MKKNVSIILAILMIVASIPFAFAAESYEITHQPTVVEPYVETNDKNATYQWCEVTEGYLIDYTTAAPFDPDAYFGSIDEYPGEVYLRGDGYWTPVYKMIGSIYEMYYFEVSLKKGETVTFDFSSEKITSVGLLYGNNFANFTVDGKTGTYTADNDGTYALQLYGPEFIAVRAWSDGKKYTAIEGESSVRLNNVEEGKNYVCCVTFSDGTVVASDEVAGHNHTSTELTCMGYKCSACGGFFGEETAEVHFFTSYAVTTAPTCTKSGVETAVCYYGCGKTDVKEIPATNHKDTLVQKEGKDATCTETGYEAYEYCTACDYNTYKEIPAGHIPVEEVRENKVAPECGVAGSYDLVVYCGKCDEEIVRVTIPVAALTHTDTDGDYVCDNGCGYEYEKPDTGCIDELVAYVEAVENEIIAKYGEEEYKAIVAALSDEANAELRAITDKALALTGSVKDNEEKLDELKVRMAVIFVGIENCLKGVHNNLSYVVTEEAKCEVNAIESAVCTLCGEEVTREVENSALTHTDEDADYKCDNGCGYEFEQPTPDTPDAPVEDEVCKDCGKIHDGFFVDFVCFFIKILNFFKNFFA